MSDFYSKQKTAPAGSGSPDEVLLIGGGVCPMPAARKTRIRRRSAPAGLRAVRPMRNRLIVNSSG